MTDLHRAPRKTERCGCRAMGAVSPMPRDQRVLLSVSGMSCERSAAVVRRALLRVAGVAEVRCHPASASVWVRLYPDQVSAESLPSWVIGRGLRARLMRLGAPRAGD